MADNGKEKSEWDTISLSSSSYTERDPSESLFTSGHFVFPPSEHENLPIEAEITELQNVNTEEEEELQVLEEEKDEERVQFFEEEISVSIYGSHEEPGPEPEPEREAGILLEREKDSKEGELNKKDLHLPCEAWWKRHAIYLYKNAKEANTFWSILVASALMGLMILGHRWHKEKWEVNSRWRFNINNERMSRILSRPSH